ncbi:MAG: adenosylmethionine--8-amino-7-oxononanoate transaminase [Desulfovibrio sp.]
MHIAEMLDFDKKHLWHPYTSMTNPLPVYPVASAKGCSVFLEDGTELLDGMASWWCAVHGYNHPRLNAAIQKQMGKMSHVMFGGITHEPAVELGQLLVELLPDELNKVFLCDSGSVSVEVAMKMAMQYWFVRSRPKRNKFLTVRRGYHGDTFNAMSVCDPDTGMHSIYSDVLPKNLFADAPKTPYYNEWDPADFDSMAELMALHTDEIAAVILEPIVQGTGGMRFYHPEYLRQLRTLCDEHEVLLIFDEIATGFGRTGKMFALEHAGVVPDIICIGKAMTGGTLTAGATVTTEDVAEVLSSNSPGVFMHGPTFMGNPLTCAVAVESLKLLKETDCLAQVSRIENKLVDLLCKYRNEKHVVDVRVLGALGVIELDTPVDMGAIQKEFVKRNVWVRPFGKLVYIMPPYVMTDDELTKVTTAMGEVVALGERIFAK